MNLPANKSSALPTAIPTEPTADAPALWQHGWLANARQQPSPNFGPRPAGTAVDFLVVHSISLPPGEYGTGCVQQLFSNQMDWDAHPYFQSIRSLEVSAHFFIERDGSLWQFVSCDDRAWHAGASQWRERSNCNNYSIGVELEGLEGHTFEPAQYRSLQQLILAIAQHYPLRDIAGHEHIAPGRKQDPGPGFDWQQLQAGLPSSPLLFP